ncbi:unnamed protein product [Diatraea saccharalis]|uniref:Mucin-2-like n=1 Tax=Diatraea saccharalis TaxID=40085 RepID=A0A9N9R248_9NEOP|nr:unnamed protein product [Diatraea saccharalis]
MEYQHALVVITLLQLCRAEISEILPGTWFSANTINDGYSPKPISELFSTEMPPSFSPENPIVVLPNLSSLSPQPEVTYISTTPATFNSFVTNTPIAPSTYSSTQVTSTPSPLDFSKPSSLAPQWPTSTTVLQTQTNRPIQTLQETLATSPLLPQTQPTGPPSFSLIYENTPSPDPPIPTVVTTIPTLSTTTTSPLSSISEGTLTPYITNGLSDTTSRPTVTFRSTPPSTTSRTTIIARDCNPTTRLINPVSTTIAPTRIISGSPDVPFKPNLRIRVVAPQGSITNVKINPTTTTKRPTTKRTKKPKKNTYEGCLDGCKGKRDPICAVPLASVIIDTKTLKGFPSICHLACHNSYKKDAYEKLIDGRCGRLRTRIITVDNNSKIQREDLKKAEYSVINTGPKTVLEFAHQPLNKD